MKSLFVGNMNFQTTESDLRELFAPFGQVTRIHMAMDRETGRARGFAFVEMPNDAEATQAMTALDGKEVGGRNLKVNEARPKGEGGPPRGPRNFSGPSGGRGPSGGGGGRGKGGGGGRDRFSNEDYRDSARQPRASRAGSSPFLVNGLTVPALPGQHFGVKESVCRPHSKNGKKK